MATQFEPKHSIQSVILDYSMTELEEVPVKNIMTHPNALKIDLSNNKISTIDPSFCNLQHIVELNLSQNILKSLPDNFGNLVNLTKLELYCNQLSSLPVSMGNLTKLRYLDLKHNRFPKNMLDIFGECDTPKDCQRCATRVVQYMQQIQRETDEKRQRETFLNEEKQEASKNLKKAAKAKRRELASTARITRIVSYQYTIGSEDITNERNGHAERSTAPTEKPPSFRKKIITGLVATSVLAAVIIALTFGVLLYIYTGGEFTKCKIVNAYELFLRDANHVIDKLRWSAEIALLFIKYLWEKAQNVFHNLTTGSKFWNGVKDATADVRHIFYRSFYHVMKQIGALCFKK